MEHQTRRRYTAEHALAAARSEIGQLKAAQEAKRFDCFDFFPPLKRFRSFFFFKQQIFFKNRALPFSFPSPLRGGQNGRACKAVEQEGRQREVWSSFRLLWCNLHFWGLSSLKLQASTCQSCSCFKNVFCQGAVAPSLRNCRGHVPKVYWSVSVQVSRHEQKKMQRKPERLKFPTLWGSTLFLKLFRFENYII